MSFNPVKLIKLKDVHKQFREEHPNMRAFGHALKEKALVEGSRFQVTVTTPQGEILQESIQLTANDIEFLQMFISREE